jgi:hypothetical protein
VVGGDPPGFILRAPHHLDTPVQLAVLNVPDVLLSSGWPVAACLAVLRDAGALAVTVRHFDDPGRLSVRSFISGLFRVPPRALLAML